MWRGRVKEVAARSHCSHSCLPSFPAAAAAHCDANFVCIVRRCTRMHSPPRAAGRRGKRRRKNASIVIYAAIYVIERARISVMRTRIIAEQFNRFEASNSTGIQYS